MDCPWVVEGVRQPSHILSNMDQCLRQIAPMTANKGQEIVCNADCGFDNKVMIGDSGHSSTTDSSVGRSRAEDPMINKTTCALAVSCSLYSI